MKNQSSCTWKLIFTIIIGGTVLIATCMSLLVISNVFLDPQTRLLSISSAGVLSLPLCILLLVVGINGWKHNGLLNLKNGLEILGGLLLVVGYIFSVRSSIAYDQAEEPFRRLASPACLGTAVPAVVSYQADDSFHPIIFLNEKGEATGSFKYESYDWHWEAAIPSELQLVACVEEKRIGLETCHYSSGGVVNRYQKMAHIQVMSIYSGMLVAEEDFFGSIPSTCPETTNNSGGDYVGGSVSEDEIKSWLAQYVNPPQK